MTLSIWSHPVGVCHRSDRQLPESVINTVLQFKYSFHRLSFVFQVSIWWSNQDQKRCLSVTTDFLLDLSLTYQIALLILAETGTKRWSCSSHFSSLGPPEACVFIQNTLHVKIFIWRSWEKGQSVLAFNKHKDLNPDPEHSLKKKKVTVTHSYNPTGKVEIGGSLGLARKLPFLNWGATSSVANTVSQNTVRGE